MVGQFIQSRKYLKAVTPKTLAWYKCSFAAFDGAINSQEAIVARIVQPIQAGSALHQYAHVMLRGGVA